MGAIVQPQMAALLAELKTATDEIIDKHLNEADALGGDKNYLQFYMPIGVQVTTIDGLTAQFYEEGIEFYPETKEAY